MTVQIDNPNPTFFDKDTNLPLAGGYVYIYTAGTLTPATTYTDSGLSVQNTSPYIELNSAGNFTNPVFFAAGSYKIKVYSAGGIATGTLQWTRDDYQVVSVAAFTAALTPNVQTGTTYSIQTTDRAALVTHNNAASIAVSLPAANSVTFPNGWYCNIQNVGVGAVTITPVTSTIDGATTLTLYTGQGAIIASDGINYYTTRNVINPSGPALDIASATTTDLGSIKSHFINITGTVTITGFGSSAAIANPIYFIKFAGILTLTHNGTSLIIPGSANITTAAGDSAVVEYLGSGNWRVRNFSVSPIGAGGTGQTTASAAFTALKQDSTTGTTGVVELATDAETTTGTDTGRVAPVSSMVYHKGTAKAWVNFTLTGSINGSYNVSSVTDNTTALKTINFTTNFSSASYVANVVQTQSSDTAYGSNQRMGALAVGSCQLFNTDEANNVTGWLMTFHGDR